MAAAVPKEQKVVLSHKCQAYKCTEDQSSGSDFCDAHHMSQSVVPCKAQGCTRKTRKYLHFCSRHGGMPIELVEAKMSGIHTKANADTT